MADGGQTARIIAELRRLILLGELLPGEQLRQEELSRRLTVSRVPLREALLVLAHQGLLTHRPNQGFAVAKRTVDELDQLHRMHTLLENELNESIHWPDEAALARLQQINDELAATSETGDVVGFIDLNHDFHRAVWDLSPLKLIVSEVERLWSLSDSYFAANYSAAERREEAVGHHRRIITALADHDMAAFQRASGEHRNDTRAGVAVGLAGHMR